MRLYPKAKPQRAGCTYNSGEHTHAHAGQIKRKRVNRGAVGQRVLIKQENKQYALGLIPTGVKRRAPPAN